MNDDQINYLLDRMAEELVKDTMEFVNEDNDINEPPMRFTLELLGISLMKCFRILLSKGVATRKEAKEGMLAIHNDVCEYIEKHETTKKKRLN